MMDTFQMITPLNSVLIALMLIIFTFLWLARRKNNKSLPPGPWGLPIIGYLPWLTETPHLDFDKLATKYGDVFRIHLMGRDYFILNNYDTIKEAFIDQKENFLGRPREFAFFFWAMGYNAVGSTNGDNWRIHRKFLLKSFAALGLGKAELEVRLHEIINPLLTYMEQTNGQPHDYADILRNCTYNVSGLLVINRTYDMHDADYVNLTDAVRNIFLGMQGCDQFLYGPWFKFFKGHKMREEYRKLLRSQMKTTTRKIVQEYLKNPNPDGEITSYMDAFYQQMLKDNANNNRDSTFDVETMIANIHAMHGASEDSFLIKYSALLLLAIHSEIQAKVQKELDEIVGRDRLPSVTDKPRLPYTEAVLNEILRKACLIPITPIHMAENETTIGGYRIPKDAACIANLYNATRDKRIFKNPDEFDPENFLDEEGKFVKNGSNIPFSLGPRNCLAEPLARISVFLFITAILQNYNLSEPPNTKSQYGTTRFAGEIFSPHQICATRRT